jgi:glycosyltransferase involved in cell wall biosynthesis
MRILILTDRFWPEIAAPSFRLIEHARAWVAAGHAVTVVTCVPNFPRGAVFEGYKNRLWQTETKDGITIIRLGTYMTANEGTVKRTLDYVSYMLAAILWAPRYPKFDVVLASSPPIFVALAGWGVSFLRGRPWVFEIRDLWPASIRAVGASKSRVLDLVERVELLLYRQADRILSLTHSFKADLTSRGVPASKIDVVTNGVDAAQFSRERATFDARSELGAGRDIVLAGYIGTVGMAHGLQTMVEAAELLRARRDVKLLILGEGAERAPLEAEAKRRGLDNLIFHDLVTHDLMPSYLAALDVSIIHLKPDPLFKTVIPSKIFESMAMGVPMIMAVEGESAQIVRDAAAGLCIPSGDARALAEAVTALADRPDERKRLADNGMRVVVERYARAPLALAAMRTLEEAVRTAAADA